MGASLASPATPEAAGTTGTTRSANVQHSGDEVSVLNSASGVYVVADLDVCQGNAVATLAEGGVFVDHDGLDDVVGALDGDFCLIDGLNRASGPGFAKVGAGFFVLFFIDDHDDHGADG